jgi:hypothetical protein
VRAAPRRGARWSARFACALAAALPLSASAITQTISDTFPGMVEALPFRAKQAIAQDVRVTVYRQYILNGKPQRPIFATNEVSPGPILYSTGAVLPARGDPQAVLAMARLNAQAGLMQASLGALATIGQALLDSDAQKLSSWTIETTGAIAPSAPPGSVLHLGFFWYVHSARFAVESRSELIVTASLERPGEGAPLQSARTVELFTYRDGNPDAVNIRQGYVKHGGHLYAADNAAVAKRLGRIPLGMQLGVLANSAVALLCAQVEGAAD